MNISLFQKLFKKVGEVDCKPTASILSEEKFNMFIFILLFITAISSFDSISILCNLNYIFFIFVALMNSSLFHGNGSVKVEDMQLQDS